MYSCRIKRTSLVVLFLAVFIGPVFAKADRANWQREYVDLRLPGGTRIKAVEYPPDNQPLIRHKKDGWQPRSTRKYIPTEDQILLDGELDSAFGAFSEDTTTDIIANVIDSPPLDGFVPWVAVVLTNARSDDMDYYSYEATSITGSPLADPQTNYAIGIFDTGAGAHVMGYYDASGAGLSGSYLTDSTVLLSGATGSVVADVSVPIGIFLDGLGACEPNGVLSDTTGMVGEWNTSIAVGPVGEPNIPNAFGTPFSVFFVADIRNSQPVTINRSNEEYTGPDIRFYQHGDPEIPDYANSIPLELYPGGTSVQYLPFIDIFAIEFYPLTPSLIIGEQSQSLYFAHTDLYDTASMAYDMFFMVDTGAQVTVISSSVAARLRLDPDEPDFLVDIQGINGDVVYMPGFFIDSMDIPAFGDWLSLTNVPVVMLDIASPGGGILDGIIGMNLFVEMNMVFKGGNFQTGGASLDFEPANLIIDMAPENGDGKVDLLDLIALAQAWQSTSEAPNWNPRCDVAPLSAVDGKVNFQDFAVLSTYWMYGTTP